MNAAAPESSVITSPAEFQALQGEWDDLWSRANGRHHQAFMVCWLCWLHVAEPRGKTLRVIVVREKGQLVAVWPLVSNRKQCWTVLRPLSPESADYTSVLVEEGPCASVRIRQAWAAARRQCGADIILLPYVSVDSELHGFASRQGRLMAAKQHPCSVAKLREESDWDTYCLSLGTLNGRKPGALERRLAKQGELEMRMLGPDDAHENASMIDWMLARKREWADRVDKKGEWLYLKEYGNYLVNLLNQAQGETLACLLVVYLDGAPVAVNMMGLGKSCVNGIMGGFDSRFAKFAPGSVAMEQCVRWVWEQRFDFDFGIGPEAFKGYWSRNNIALVSSMQIANTHWGSLAFMADGLRRTFGRCMAALRTMTRTKRQDGVDSQCIQPDLGKDRSG
jgi:CelD/BcsL family acetyltransferase involved in cellulose biosynthesis